MKTKKRKNKSWKSNKQIAELYLMLLGILTLFILVFNDPSIIGLIITKETQRSIEPYNQTGAWNTVENVNYINSTAMFTNTIGSMLEYKFNGSSVKIVTQKRNDFGIMSINIDNMYYQIDLYSNEIQYSVVNEFDLEESSHELTISATNQKNDGSTDYYILVDEVIIASYESSINITAHEENKTEINETTEFNTTKLNATELNGTALNISSADNISTEENNLLILSEAEELNLSGLWFMAEDSIYSNNISLVSNYMNDSLEYEFNGRNIYILTEKRDDFGVANVTIDNESYLVDFYSPENIKPYLISIKELEGSDHKLKMQQTQLKNNASNDHYIAIDAFLQSRIGNLSGSNLYSIDGIIINEINDTLYSETTTRNQTAENETIISAVRINEPVKWTKTFTINETKNNLSIELQPGILNISITKRDKENKESSIEDDKMSIIDGAQQKNISEFISLNHIIELEREQGLKKRFNISTADIDQKIDNIKNNRNNKNKKSAFDWNIMTGNFIVLITGMDIFEQDETNATLIIDESFAEDDQLVIEYYTEAPIAIEQNISEYKKEIFISSETHYENILAYTTISDSPLQAIKVYRTTNNTRESTQIYNYSDTNNNSLIDYIEWIVPHLSNETYEISIEILTVQSYPTVNGNWTVMFETIGTANLTIRASNGTTWTDDYNETFDQYDLELLQLRCGDNVQNYTWTDDSVVIENYDCNETGYETSKVLTGGKHTLMFSFNDVVGYAYNDATYMSISLALTNSTVATDSIVYASGNLNLSNGTIMNYSTIYINSPNTINISYHWFTSGSYQHQYRYPVIIESSTSQTNVPVHVTGQQILTGSGLDPNSLTITNIEVVDPNAQFENKGEKLTHTFTDTDSDNAFDTADFITFLVNVTAGEKRLIYIYDQSNG